MNDDLGLALSAAFPGIRWEFRKSVYRARVGPIIVSVEKLNNSYTSRAGDTFFNTKTVADAVAGIRKRLGMFHTGFEQALQPPAASEIKMSEPTKEHKSIADRLDETRTLTSQRNELIQARADLADAQEALEEINEELTSAMEDLKTLADWAANVFIAAGDRLSVVDCESKYAAQRLRQWIINRNG